MKTLINQCYHKRDFLTVYFDAYKHYISGDWMKAKDYYEQAIQMRQNDGPSNVIMKFMNEYEFMSEKANWKGYRELTSK